MTKEEWTRIKKEIDDLMQFDKMFLIELILNLERDNHNLEEKISALRKGDKNNDQ